MARFERRRWNSGEGGVTRRDRKPCDYSAYIPDHLAGRRFLIEGDVTADVADAEAALIRFNETAVALANTEALARLLLRAEAVASSRIEGLEVGGRRLLRAVAERQSGEVVSDVTAAEVLGNIEAMEWAIRMISDGQEITVDVIRETHRRLLEGTRFEEYGGHLRTEQNWIGGSSFNPCSAAFVPPPPEMVDDLLVDLCNFCNDDSLPPVAQAAIAHAQFETIDPFVDGNGRTGRALLHLILRRRGTAPRILPPVSLVLATWSADYIARLDGTRYEGDVDSEESRAGINQWIGLFAAACQKAVADARNFEAHVNEIQQTWRSRLGAVRRGSAVDLLIDALPALPVLTVNTGAELIQRSFPAANLAIDRLVDAEILSPIKSGRRNRAFEARELIDAFTALERQLASPSGNTRASAPIRRVPYRRTPAK